MIFQRCISNDEQQFSYVFVFFERYLKEDISRDASTKDGQNLNTSSEQHRYISIHVPLGHVSTIVLAY